MSPEQLHTLQHTIGTDEFGRRQCDRNMFVTDPDSTDGQLCRSLVALGLMTDHGPQSIAGGMTLYRATQAGRDAVARESPKPPKLTRSQQRYKEFLSLDGMMTFREFLDYKKAHP